MLQPPYYDGRIHEALDRQATSPAHMGLRVDPQLGLLFTRPPQEGAGVAAQEAEVERAAAQLGRLDAVMEGSPPSTPGAEEEEEEEGGAEAE